MKLWFIATAKVIGRALFNVIKYIVLTFGVLLILASLSTIPIAEQVIDVILFLGLLGVGILLIVTIIIAVKEAVEDEYRKLKRKDD